MARLASKGKAVRALPARGHLAHERSSAQGEHARAAHVLDDVLDGGLCTQHLAPLQRLCIWWSFWVAGHAQEGESGDEEACQLIAPGMPLACSSPSFVLHKSSAGLVIMAGGLS